MDLRVSPDKDVNVGSYTVPKGVPVQMNLYAMHHDNEHWGDPLTFRPHRFLNQQGTAVVMDEWLQPFGYGKLKFTYSAMCIIFEEYVINAFICRQTEMSG